MKELQDIIDAYNAAEATNTPVALVTVVKVEGSSYRRPGARMLVTSNGDITGAISGGCLEGDALRKAQFAMQQQVNKLEIYDTSDDNDDRLGVQLGCNGIVHILFEPVNPQHNNNPINLLKKMAANRQNAVLVTAFNPDKTAPQKGTVCCVTASASFHEAGYQQLAEAAKAVLHQKTSSVVEDGNGATLFQYVSPAIQLVVAGAGNDAQPLCEIAVLLGWQVVVVDGRPAYATAQRFPKATCVSVTRPADILTAVNIDEHTAFVLMTHNFNYDLAALQQLITVNCNYIGVLGPKKKLEKLEAALRENGHDISKETSRHIYGPVGLDIGAETAEEIALSIVSEIKAVFARRHGRMLKERTEPIHARNIQI